jgi:hypothetical protein
VYPANKNKQDANICGPVDAKGPFPPDTSTTMHIIPSVLRPLFLSKTYFDFGFGNFVQRFTIAQWERLVPIMTGSKHKVALLHFGLREKKRKKGEIFYFSSTQQKTKKFWVAVTVRRFSNSDFMRPPS